jgi:hypothetical protein
MSNIGARKHYRNARKRAAGRTETLTGGPTAEHSVTRDGVCVKRSE